MSKTKKLRDFEGLPVERTTIALTNAGDGLSQAMKIDPSEYHVGDKAYLIIEGECTKVAFLPLTASEPDGAQVRLHTFRAGTATVADGELIRDLIAAQAEKNLRAKEAEQGVQRLPLTEESERTIRVRTWLSSLKKSELVDLCDRHDIEHTTKHTASDLIDLLAENADAIAAEMGEG